MKKIILSALVTVLACTATHSQVSLQPAIPAAGIIQKTQLWNLVVINNSGQSYSARLDIVLTDRATGLDILSAASATFSLPAGARQLNIDAISPVQYNTTGISFDIRGLGLIPAGYYTACYSLVAIGLKETILSEECASFDAEPLSPPMLIFPADSSELELNASQFSWIPPMPADMFTGLRYELLITKVNEGQNAAEAIEENLPFYVDGNQATTTVMYPASAAVFEKGKWYAWQVVARDNKSYSGKSEVWVFRVKENPKTETPSNATYILLSENDPARGVYYLRGQELNIKYYSFDKETKAKIRIRSADDQVVREFEQKLVYGDNFFSVSLGNSVSRNKTYILELTTAAKKVYRALFSLVQD
ncbi:MAG: hypothetical protein U0T79_03865 [Ferruginibacter sp.]